MAYPKMKPCPKCGNTDLSIYTYDSGWRHVECDECLYLGPGEGTKANAVKQHNEQFEATKASYDALRQNPSPQPIVKPYAAATTDHTGCVHIGPVKQIEEIAASGAKGPTEVVYLYEGPSPQTRQEE